MHKTVVCRSSFLLLPGEHFIGNSASETCAALGYSQGKVVCAPGVLPATLTTLYLLIYDVCGLHHSAHERRQRTTCRTWLLPPTTQVLSVKHRQLGVSSRQFYALSHCTHSCTWEHFFVFHLNLQKILHSKCSYSDFYYFEETTIKKTLVESV